MWLWVTVETMNGVVNAAIALWRGAYFPGAATAPVLLLLPLFLASRLFIRASG
jgi:hypothetical protein